MKELDIFLRKIEKIFKEIKERISIDTSYFIEYEKLKEYEENLQENLKNLELAELNFSNIYSNTQEENKNIVLNKDIIEEVASLMKNNSLEEIAINSNSLEENIEIVTSTQSIAKGIELISNSAPMPRIDAKKQIQAQDFVQIERIEKKVEEIYTETKKNSNNYNKIEQNKKKEKNAFENIDKNSLQEQFSCTNLVNSLNSGVIQK